MKILFFGSTTDSVIVAEKIAPLGITAVVTQPPKPIGRDRTVTPTPVEAWAKQRNITTLSFPSNPEKPWLFADEQQVIDALEPIRADLIISASYGQKIPTKTIADTAFGGLNIHPSILPRWRGGDPVPWAIMTGDHQTGVTVVSLSERFDEGKIYAQKKIPIKPTDTSTPLRTTLFEIGAQLLTDLLPLYIDGKAKGIAQHLHDAPRATRLSRETGFELWEHIRDPHETERIERKWRALHPWPGMWTRLTVPTSSDGGSLMKRLKILKLHLDNGLLVLDEVQIEGKKPVSWEQFEKAYLSP